MTNIDIYTSEITPVINLIPKGEFVGVSFVLSSVNDRLSRKESAVTFWVRNSGQMDRRQFADSLRNVANRLEQMKTSEVL